MSRPTASAQELAAGLGEPDPEAPIDPLAEIGLESEERLAREENALEMVDVLAGLREMQSADPISWNISRVGESDPEKNGFLARWATTMLTQERIRDEFGGGTYRIRGVRQNGQFAAQRTITIAGDAPRKFPGGKMTQSNSQGFDAGQFFAMMDVRDRQSRREVQEREAAAEAREERARKARMDLITTLAPILAPIGTALVTGLVGRAAPPVTDPIASLKGLAETMSLMQGLTGGGGDSGDSLVEIIKAVAPHAGPALAALASRPAAAPQRQRVLRTAIPGAQPTRIQAASPGAAPAPAPVAVQATVVPGPTPHTGVNLDAPSQPTTQEDRNMFAQLKPQVDTLVQMFRDGADPVQCAQVFFDTTMMNVDDSTYDKLCGFFENPGAVTQIAIFNTGVQEMHAQFQAFQNKVRELIGAQDQAAQNVPAG